MALINYSSEAITQGSQYCYKCGHTMFFGAIPKLVCKHCGTMNYRQSEKGNKEYFKDMLVKTNYKLKREDIDKRIAGHNTTLDNKLLSEETVDKNKRYSQIIETLNEYKELTAKEIAVEMYNKGYIPTSERNFTSPRLTELLKDGLVEIVGTTKCKYSNKTVSVYGLRG